MLNMLNDLRKMAQLISGSNAASDEQLIADLAEKAKKANTYKKRAVMVLLILSLFLIGSIVIGPWLMMAIIGIVSLIMYILAQGNEEKTAIKKIAVLEKAEAEAAKNQAEVEAAKAEAEAAKNQAAAQAAAYENFIRSIVREEMAAAKTPPI